MAETLDLSTDIRENFIHQFITEGGVTSDKVATMLYDYLNKIKDNKVLVSKCIEGVDQTELKGYRESNGFYATRDLGKMVLDPLPNLYAPRDPFASLGDGISLHKMQTVTRSRETIFAEYIFNYHPEYKKVHKYYDRYDNYTIEGGDVQVLSDSVIGIGISERTEPDAIALLAKRIFSSDDNNFKYVLAFDIPDERSFMHLDTVLTRIDYDKFAVHAHVMDVTNVYEITDDNEEVKIKKVDMPLDKLLEHYLHINKVDLIKCGNGERIASEREQWSDGANALCVKPGVIITYDRNFVSNENYRKHGVRVIEIPSCELSKGRGGPHCMSMALVRED